MISLKEHRTGLINLNGTITALETFDSLIDHYSENKPGPAYLTVNHFGNQPAIQIDREIMVQALKDQRQRLVEYLATMGIDANQ